MNRTRTRLLSVVGAMTLSAGLTLAVTPSASANPPVVRLHSFATKAECVKAQSSPAYNNSYVRVTKACFRNPIVPNWNFETLARY